MEPLKDKFIYKKNSNGRSTGTQLFVDNVDKILFICNVMPDWQGIPLYFTFLMLPLVCYKLFCSCLLNWAPAKGLFGHYFINLHLHCIFWLLHQFWRFAEFPRHFFVFYEKHWKLNLSWLMKLNIFFGQDSDLKKVFNQRWRKWVLHMFLS